MWQRFKDVVDTKIQEEAARQRLEQRSSSVTSSPRSRPRAGSRPISPTRRLRRRDTDGPFAAASDLLTTTGKGPDPSEFEPEFVIGDNSEMSTRVGTPVPGAHKPSEPGTSKDNKESKLAGDSPDAAGDAEYHGTVEESEKKTELTSEVQQRLRKLDRLEPKYSELLRSYRVAHSRISTIESFEATLREHTPLTSIADPTSFVEYLQQSSLKSTMLMDELKKSVYERDDLKKKGHAAEERSKQLEEELGKLKAAKATESTNEHKNPDQPPKKDDSEDFFSYESEIQNEVQDLESQLSKVRAENTLLTNDLASAKKAMEELTQNHVVAKEELKTLRDAKHEDDDELRAQIARYTAEIVSLNHTIEGQQNEIKKRNDVMSSLERSLEELRSKIASEKSGSESKVKDLAQSIKRLEKDLSDAQEFTADEKKRSKTLQNLVETLRAQVQNAHANTSPEVQVNGVTSGSLGAEPSRSEDSFAATKKKNKKKKKGAKAAEAIDNPETVKADLLPSETAPRANHTNPGKLELLEKELESLHALCADKDAIITRFESRMKDQDGLIEEIETLRDEVISLGQDSVESKAEVKNLQTERSSLRESIAKLENEIAELKANGESSADTAKAHESLTADFKRLKIKADTLEVDLSAAQKLAATRFKDLSDLREVLQKAQPELQSLRMEVSELRKSKEEFLGRAAEVRKLEAREKDLKNEISRWKKQLSERDSDVRGVNEKLTSTSNARKEIEESLRKVQRDLKIAQTERKDALDSRERDVTDLNKAQEELRTTTSSLSTMETQLSSLTADASGLRDELTLKSAQYASAQSLMTSMQDQTQELSAQMRETRERCESLEEELADAHRLLGERGREAETMRRLLADVDGRADQRVRNMQERLDAAVEERDRAEDQAGSVGRKRAKEIEDLKNKVRNAEAAFRKAEGEKEDVEAQEKNLRRQKEEIEARSSKADSEIAEVREAMGRLRDALDETERTSRELEREKGELRQTLNEITQRLEKLQRSNKTMSEELKTLQGQHGVASNLSRSSLESSRSTSRLASPPPRNAASPAGSVQGKIDYVYLKNVLLQFMEQKDKKHQMALVPVLGMLLHFDGKDEQKWMTAIKAT